MGTGCLRESYLTVSAISLFGIVRDVCVVLWSVARCVGLGSTSGVIMSTIGSSVSRVGFGVVLA